MEDMRGRATVKVVDLVLRDSPETLRELEIQMGIEDRIGGFAGSIGEMHEL